MSRRAVLGMTLAGLGGGAVIYGTGAYDAIEGQRAFNLGVSDDDEALLGISAYDPSGSDGEEVTLLELENRFSETLESISVDVLDAGDLSVSALETPSELESGESGDVTAILECGGDGVSWISLLITAAGPRETVEATREIPIECDGTTVETIEGNPDLQDETISTPLRVKVTGRDDIDIQDSTIEGYLELEPRGNTHIDIQGSTIEGYLDIDATGSATSIDIQGTTVEGDLSISAGDDIDVQDTDIGGDLIIEDGDNIDVQGTDIGGNLVINDADDIDVQGNSIGGNFVINVGNNINVQGNDIGGNLQINDGNNIDVQDNDIGGNLENNSGTTMDEQDNDVDGVID